jgi:hypothetical protein
MKIKRFIVTVIVCAVVLLTAALLSGYWTDKPNRDILKVGFVYSEDESTPYTANFVMAQRALQAEYDGKIEAAAADYQELTRLLGEKEAAELVLMDLMEQWESAQE